MPERLPPLNSLKAFEAAARHLSVKNAALELNVTPAAVSHQIRTLEEYLAFAKGAAEEEKKEKPAADGKKGESALKQFNPSIKVVSFQPDSPFHGLEGLKHMESAIVPGIYDPALADEDVRVGTEEAFAYTRRLASEGIFVGITSGGTFAGALKVASEAEKGANILCMLPDTGERYLSTPMFEGIVEGMDEEEKRISKSTPGYQMPA